MAERRGRTPRLSACPQTIEIQQSKFYHIQHGPLYIQRRFSIQHQGQCYVVAICTGMQHGSIVQGFLAARRMIYGKMQRQHICKRAAGRLPDKDFPHGW